jgi:hypothetical protein
MQHLIRIFHETFRSIQSVRRINSCSAQLSISINQIVPPLNGSLYGTLPTLKVGHGSQLVPACCAIALVQ